MKSAGEKRDQIVINDRNTKEFRKVAVGYKQRCGSWWFGSRPGPCIDLVLLGRNQQTECPVDRYIGQKGGA